MSMFWELHQTRRIGEAESGPVVLRLVKGGTVTVELESPPPEDAANRVVELVPDGPHGDGHPGTILGETDEKGTVRFEMVRPGSYRATVLGEEAWRPSPLFTVTAGGTRNLLIRRRW